MERGNAPEVDLVPEAHPFTFADVIRPSGTGRATVRGLLARGEIRGAHFIALNPPFAKLGELRESKYPWNHPIHKLSWIFVEG